MIHYLRQTLRPPTVGRALLAVVLLALIAPFVVYAVPATVGAEASYVVLTASMTPAIAPGDVVIVDSVPARDIAAGDVIVFEQQAGDPIPITHRVIAVDRTADAPPAFRTQGDANEDADLTPVTPDRLIGRVAFTIPLIGHVIQFVGTPAGFVALVVLPLGLLVVSEVFDLVRAGRSGASDAEAVAADADDGAVADASTSPDADAAPVGADQVVVTPADLTLTSVALGAFAAYAAYLAVQRPTTASVTLAVAGGALFVLAAGIRLFAPFDPATDGRPTTPPVVHLHGARSAGPTVEVADAADLRDIAATLGRPVLRDDRERFVVLDGVVTYACDAPTPESDAEADADVPVDPDDDSDADVEPVVESDPTVPTSAESATTTAPKSGGASR